MTGWHWPRLLGVLFVGAVDLVALLVLVWLFWSPDLVGAVVTFAAIVAAHVVAIAGVLWLADHWPRHTGGG